MDTRQSFIHKRLQVDRTEAPVQSMQYNINSSGQKLGLKLRTAQLTEVRLSSFHLHGHTLGFQSTAVVIFGDVSSFLATPYQ